MQLIPDHARCIACNYPLRQLPNPRCPECGRPFNPDDPKTINLGRVPGPIARRLLRHTGWPILCLAVAVTIALLITSGPPRMVMPQLADTWYLLDYHQWKQGRPNGFDAVYVAAVVLWLGVAILLALHTTLRLIAQHIYVQRDPPSRRRAIRQTILLLAMLCSVAAILMAWPVRVARIWVASAKPPPIGLTFSPVTRFNRCPIKLSESEEITALREASTSGWRARRDRLATLNLFVEQYPSKAVEVVESMVSDKGDPDLRLLAVHVLSAAHQPQSAALFRNLLDDPSPAIRAAAVDAIDILRGPGLTRPHTVWAAPPAEVIADPPINVGSLLQGTDLYRPATTLPSIAFDAQTRDALEKMMISGVTSDEREAAARAIVNWPPQNYQLRAAEWGVWVADAEGNLAIVQSLLDEIPLFVHRIGNPHKSFADRYPRFMGAVGKPIVHLTTDRPLALDVQAFIYFGRPWFAYPKPDDLALSRIIENQAASPTKQNWSSEDIVKNLDDLALPSMPDLHEGYPWLNPPHRFRLEDPRGGRRGAGFTGPNYFSLGIRWQSLIILPNQASWMSPPSVPADPKFKWWSDLRAVPSSYIASRGESERFLYYDGPTHAKPPLIASLKDNTLTLRSYPDPAAVPHSKRFPQPNEITPLEQDRTEIRDHREAFFIRVTNGQPSAIRFKLSAMRFERPDWNDATLPLPATLPIPADQTIPAFKSLLTDYGLTPEESDGLIAAWRTQFFQTNGQRLLLRLSAADYDALCPLSIRPAPTTLVRLGFVLTEF